MAKFSFVKCDIDGEGKRWRLMVDTESYLTLADEDFTCPDTRLKRAAIRSSGLSALSNSSRPSRDCAVGKLSVVLTSLERAPSTDLRSSRKRHSASLDDLGFARVALQMPGLRGARRVFRPAGAPNVSDLPGPESRTPV